MIITTVCILLFLVHVAWNSSKYDDVVKLTQPHHVNMAETGSVAVQHVQEDTDIFSLASSQSYGFFDDVTDKHWKRLQKIAVEHVNHKYPEQPLTHNPLFDKRKIHTTSYPAWWQTNYEPNFSCQFEKRVGWNTNGDGPKWVCDPHRITEQAAKRKAADPNHPGCVVYSIGSNGDFSFEWGLQKEVGEGVCEFHIFDMGDYESKVPADLKRAHYHRWGLKGQDSKVDKPEAGQQFYGMLDTIKLLGHENLEVIDIFKIDCEKCEWNTYQDWLGAGIPLLHQIQVELHSAPGQTAIDFFDSFERAGYLRFHKEPNIQFSDGSCIEYAFVKVEEKFLDGKEFTKAK